LFAGHLRLASLRRYENTHHKQVALLDHQLFFEYLTAFSTGFKKASDPVFPVFQCCMAWAICTPSSHLCCKLLVSSSSQQLGIVQQLGSS
jgi:hypothetical protein